MADVSSKPPQGASTPSKSSAGNRPASSDDKSLNHDAQGKKEPQQTTAAKPDTPKPAVQGNETKRE